MSDRIADLQQKLARLLVRTGANVGEGQDVDVVCQPEHRALAHAVCEEAYLAGARHVNINYWDPFQKLFRLRHADKETLEYVPDWWDARSQELIDKHGARITLAGDPHPGLLDGIDPERSKLDRMPVTPKWLEVPMSGEANWCIGPGPNEAWATKIFGEPDVERLWEAIAVTTRLDEPDPVAAWNAHLDRLMARADSLTELELDRLEYSGPGTDFTVGMMEGHRWVAASIETSWGRRFIPNMPTEEVFTTPHRERTEGTASTTMPFLLEGTIVEGLKLTFEGGRIVDIQADKNGEIVRGHTSRDEGASRLGEVALVDVASPVNQTNILFHNTLFDENAACHMAWGQGIEWAVPGLSNDHDEQVKAGFNRSSVHLDVMIGSDQLDVEGVTKDGRRVQLLKAGEWVLGT